MWLVRLALGRPYTFLILSLLIVIMGGWFIVWTPKDIFPNVDIPVVNVIWTYEGLAADDFEKRITTFSEFSLSQTISDIERIESQTQDGIAVIRLFFYPSVNINSAVAQATSSSQSVLRRMPRGVVPPIIVPYTANSVPILQVLLSSDTLSEMELYDYGIYRLRQSIASLEGVTIPTPYGGKTRQLMIDVDPIALQAHGLSPRDVNDAINAQNLILPTGDSRIGTFDYRVNMNNTPVLPEEYNDIPIKKINDVVVYLRDVGFAHDGFLPQTSIVRNNSKRAVMLTILKSGSTSTLDVVNKIRAMLPDLRAAAPKGMNIDLLFDQSVFVRSAISSVVEEGVIAAFLTGSVIFLFLMSWRSTLIVFVAIPLSILSSIILLSLTGYTLNIMTLGGLALAIGILVDDATVTLENIHRNIHLGKPLREAILVGSQQIIFPAIVSVLSISIVFLPVVLLVGASKYLFVPFALAVVFAIGSSFFLSRTLVPTMIDYLLVNEFSQRKVKPKSALQVFSIRFAYGFHRFRSRYAKLLHAALQNRVLVLILFGVLFGSTLFLLPSIGRDFFPNVDAGQIRLHVQARTGTRIEVTEEIFGEVEKEIKKVIPQNEIQFLIDNIGIVLEPYNYAFGTNMSLGTYDGEILVALNAQKTKSTLDYKRELRKHLGDRFPDLKFFFEPADIITQILNFGVPAPIDVRVIGYDTKNNFRVAKELLERISRVPGAADVNIHQVEDFPELFLEVDRTLLALVGLNQKNVSDDVLISYSTSSIVTPNFWLDHQNGIPYLIAIQTPKYRVNSVKTLMNMPVSTPDTKHSQLLTNLSGLQRRSTLGVATHYNVQPVYDIFTNVHGRDLGGLASDISSIVKEMNKKMAPGNVIVLRGVAESMNQAFVRLGLGLIFSFILIYSILVINFQSWIDPFVIIMALPGAITGVIWMLFLTHTTFSVPSLMGTIMATGLATANSILLVSFANAHLKEGKDTYESVLEAGSKRLRPIIMTAFAMIFGMMPMAFALGNAGEENAPLGRAVIGGLCIATLTTLFFVPVLFTYFRQKPNPYFGGGQLV